MGRGIQNAVRITGKEQVCYETVRIRMASVSGVIRVSRPGQFGMLTVKSPDWETPLQRPFSFSGQGDMTIRVAYSEQGLPCDKRTVAGKVSSYIVNDLEVGNLALLTAPLGNCFFDFRAEMDGADAVYLVGGGCGAAPLYYTAKSSVMLNKKCLVFSGAKTKSALLRDEELKPVFATKDGSEGEKGTVVDLMKKYGKFEKDSVFLLCGPKAMLKCAAEEARKYTNPDKILVDTETYMGCGRGVCNKCGISVKRDGVIHSYNACTDGPVFRYSDIRGSDFFEFETVRSGARKRIPI